MNYVNLHCHSHYSVMDAIATAEDYAKRIVKSRGKYLAITDHGVLSGVWEQKAVCEQYGLHPIYGCEMYIVDDLFIKERGYNHITVIVENEAGWKNLLWLTERSYVKGFYYKPRIDWESLAKCKDGLIILSGCMAGVISKCILQDDYMAAKRWAKWFVDVFGDNFYLEIMPNGMSEQIKVNSGIYRLYKSLNIPMVITTDSHYVYRSDWEVHDMALAISRREHFYDEKRFHYSSRDFYFYKDKEVFLKTKENNPFIKKRDIRLAMEKSLEVAERCDFDLVGTKRLPKFIRHKDIDYARVRSKYQGNDFRNNYDYLKAKCRYGLEDRRPGYTSSSSVYSERMFKELEVINKTGFVDYMLIVSDIVGWAKVNDIEVGVARGSAAGSIVAYLLGITEIDSIWFGLLFERFMTEIRMQTEMPDIDVDIQRDKRGAVIEYVREKYGAENICSVIGHSKLGAKGSLKAVATSLKIPYMEANRISKLFNYGESFADAYKRGSETRDIRRQKEYEDWFLFAEKLEGRIRYSTKHAAGLIIAPGRMRKFIPLCLSRDKETMSQWDKKDLESAGMLKIDLLGLSTLETIHEAVKLIKKRHSKTIRMDDMNLEDRRILKEFNRGNTISAFQFETDSLRGLLRGTPVKSFGVLPMLNALGRPATLQMGVHEDFMRRARGETAVTYLHSSLEPILRDTFGIIIYQEQVQQIAHEVGGLTLVDADMLRRAMAKKIPKEMRGFKKDFLKGAVSKGVDLDVAKKIWVFINSFAAYTFNKSHAVSYSYISWQCMFLKIYYPLEWFVSLLSTEIGSPEKIVQYKNYIEREGMRVRPADVNRSKVLFCITGKKVIRWGLSAIKNIGHKGACKVIDLQPFCDIDDFAEKMGAINKRVVLALVRSGATDSLGKAIDVLKACNRFKKEAYNDEIEKMQSENYDNVLNDEMYYYGFVFSDLFASYRKVIADRKLLPVVSWDTKVGFNSVSVGYGAVMRKKEYDISTGKMAFITIGDTINEIELLCWPDVYLLLKKYIRVGKVVWCKIKKLKKRSKDEDQKYLLVGIGFL